MTEAANAINEIWKWILTAIMGLASALVFGWKKDTDIRLKEIDKKMEENTKYRSDCQLKTQDEISNLREELRVGFAEIKGLLKQSS